MSTDDVVNALQELAEVPQTQQTLGGALAGIAETATTSVGARRDAEDQAEVDLATGLLMVTQACTAEQAAGLLREAAAHDEQTILQIAHRIIQQHDHSR